MKKFVAMVLFMILSAVSAAGPVSADTLKGRRILVAAASDLALAMGEIAAGFEQYTGAKAVVTYGSTGMLARQIEEGAPFDVFFAAGETQVNELKKGGHVLPDTVEVYARGRIVLAANKASGVKVKNMRDLLSPEIKKVAVANPEHAPYGVAAVEALKSEGIWEKVKGKIVYGENVRQTLQYIQTGNAQAGIVALSIAGVPEITYTPIEPSLHGPIKQTAAVVKATGNEVISRAFIKYVMGAKGAPILKKYGFILP